MPRARQRGGGTLVGKTLLDLVQRIIAWLHARTRFVTSRLLGRPPRPPRVALSDARCNRVRVTCVAVATSNFNQDSYQLSWRAVRPGGGPEAAWACDAWGPSAERIVARLAGDTAYQLRGRARNVKGESVWGDVLEARTLHVPRDGGCCLARRGYTWTQTAAEVSVAWKVPASLTARDVKVALRPQRLAVSLAAGPEPSASASCVLVDDELYGRVRLLSPDGGSYWEIDRDGAESVLCVVLEKEKAATSVKWAFWRAAFREHEEIDTHAIEEASGDDARAAEARTMRKRFAQWPPAGDGDVSELLRAVRPL